MKRSMNFLAATFLFIAFANPTIAAAGNDTCVGVRRDHWWYLHATHQHHQWQYVS